MYADNVDTWQDDIVKGQEAKIVELPVVICLIRGKYFLFILTKQILNYLVILPAMSPPNQPIMAEKYNTPAICSTMNWTNWVKRLTFLDLKK